MGYWAHFLTPCIPVQQAASDVSRGSDIVLLVNAVFVSPRTWDRFP
jgi:hypothetical protein